MFKNKAEYFIYCLKNGAYKHKPWVYSMFGVTGLNEYAGETLVPGKLFSINNGTAVQTWAISGEGENQTGDFVEVPFYDPTSTEPFIKYNEKLILPAGTLANQKAEVETTYTRAWFNQAILCDHFGDKIPYHNTQWAPRDIEKLVKEQLLAKTIEPTSYWGFVQASMHTTAFMQLFVPTGSDATITVPKEVIQLRDKLLAEYKDQLDDPVIVAKIENQLTALDKELMQKHRSAAFFKSGKSYAIVRKRMFIMYGGEKSIEDPNKVTLVVPSLMEGLDTSKLPEMMNTTRNGIHSRSSKTALGGESVKFLARVFQNCAVTMEDCKTKAGVSWYLNENNYKLFEGRYLLSRPEKPLTVEELQKKIGTTVTFRSPIACHGSHTDYCRKCMGEVSSSFPDSLGIQAIKLGSTFMGIEMGAINKCVASTRKGGMRISLIAGSC